MTRVPALGDSDGGRPDTPPGPRPDRFNEDSLYEAIVSVWGEHGAHADVYRHVLSLAREAGPLREAVTDARKRFEILGYDDVAARLRELEGSDG